MFHYLILRSVSRLDLPVFPSILRPFDFPIFQPKNLSSILVSCLDHDKTNDNDVLFLGVLYCGSLLLGKIKRVLQCTNLKFFRNRPVELHRVDQHQQQSTRSVDYKPQFIRRLSRVRVPVITIPSGSLSRIRPLVAPMCSGEVVSLENRKSIKCITDLRVLLV